MNEKIDETVNTILQNAIDAATQGTEFLKEQLPDVLKQLITWNIGREIIIIVLWLIAFFVVYKIVKLSLNAIKEDHDMVAVLIIPLVGCLIAVLLGNIIVCESLLDLTELLLAPKVWLLEYGAHLVKGH